MSLFVRLRADPIARALADQFMATVLVCRTETAGAHLRQTFWHSIQNGVTEDDTLEAMRLCWREQCCPTPQQFDGYYVDQYLPTRVHETLALVPERPSSYLDIGYGNGRVTAELARLWGLDCSSATGIE